MGEFTGLVAVLMIFGLPCLAVWTHHQRKILQMKDQGSSGEVAQLRAKVERMEQRMMVLEKLATDPSARLADDIERLRDKRV
jgi:hypothetical protein